LGYEFGDHLDVILPLLHRGGLALGIAAVVAIVAGALIYRARARKAGALRRAQGDTGLG
jgi:hypothetical protein